MIVSGFKKTDHFVTTAYYETEFQYLKSHKILQPRFFKYLKQCHVVNANNMKKSPRLSFTCPVLFGAPSQTSELELLLDRLFPSFFIRSSYRAIMSSDDDDGDT